MIKENDEQNKENKGEWELETEEDRKEMKRDGGGGIKKKGGGGGGQAGNK